MQYKNTASSFFDKFDFPYVVLCFSCISCIMITIHWCVYMLQSTLLLSAIYCLLKLRLLSLSINLNLELSRLLWVVNRACSHEFLLRSVFLISQNYDKAATKCHFVFILIINLFFSWFLVSLILRWMLINELVCLPLYWVISRGLIKIFHQAIWSTPS